MSFKNNIIIISATVVCFGFTVAQAEARSFKAKYYKECYAPVKAIEPLLEEKGGVGGTARKMAKAGGLFGKVGGLVGMGGVANTVGKASKAVNTADKYSTIISDVSAYMSQMKKDHPNSGDRFSAYGDQMTREAEDLDKVQLAIKQSQDCYDNAYMTLSEKVAAKEIKKKKAKKHLKDIQKGTKASGDKLLTTMKRLNTNIKSYDQTFNNEGNSLGLDYGTMGYGATNRHISFGSLNSLAGLAGVRPTVATHAVAGVADNLVARPANLETAQLTESELAAQEMRSGLQNAGMSSRKYLDLYDAVSERVESQKILEAKVKKRPW